MTIKKTCPICGGVNIFVDATAIWDERIEGWILADAFPDGDVPPYCNDCDCTILDIVTTESES